MKTPNGCGFVWAADEEVALVEGVGEYGFNFERITAEAGGRLFSR